MAPNSFQIKTNLSHSGENQSEQGRQNGALNGSEGHGDDRKKNGKDRKDPKEPKEPKETKVPKAKTPDQEAKAVS